MALDTTIGGASADSYVTLAEFQSYWTARGVDLTQHGHDASHEANLRVAAQFLDTSYVYLGYPTSQAQARVWPRVVTSLVNNWPVASDTIPQAVKSAQCEMAYLIHEGATPFATIDGVVGSERVKAGPVESDVTYIGGKAQARYPAVSRLLRPYLAAGEGQVAMVRG